MKPKQWSRNSSYSERLLIWAGFISSIKALLIYALGIPIALVLAAHPAAAQSVLQGNPQQPINWVRTLVNLLVWVMVAVGLFGLAKGILRGIRGQGDWGGSIAWGGAALGFGGLIAFINAIVNGDPLNLPGW